MSCHEPIKIIPSCTGIVGRQANVCVMSCHVMSCHCVMSCHVMSLCHVMSCHVSAKHTMKQSDSVSDGNTVSWFFPTREPPAMADPPPIKLIGSIYNKVGSYNITSEVRYI